MSDTLLVIDDEDSIRHAIKRCFKDEEVIDAATAEDALVLMDDHYPDLILLDQQLPDGDGLDLMQKLRAIDQDIPIVFMTGHGSVDLAVGALKDGASDFIEKPFRLEHLRNTVNLLLDRQKLGRQVARLSGSGKDQKKIIAESPGMKRVLAMIKRVAAVPSTTVLIYGESGVGKELVASSIHQRSSRRSKSFIAINCAALSEHLLEAELFGYVKGAFTGADDNGKTGLFEAADGGTVFLDEIGEMPMALQAKLLRVLQERRIRRVGGLDDIDVDVRVVAATNRDLREEVAAGRFREDLYYRLRVVPLEVPPLRERPKDILPMAKNFLSRLSQELGRPGIQISSDAAREMEAYAWPGNVRELHNAIERAVIVAASDEISADDLCMDERLDLRPRAQVDNAGVESSAVHAAVSAAQAAALASASVVEANVDPAASLPEGSLVIEPGMRNLAEIERLIVRTVMKESGGKKTVASDMLGINRTTLYNKIKDIDEPVAVAEVEEDA